MQARSSDSLLGDSSSVKKALYQSALTTQQRLLLLGLNFLPLAHLAAVIAVAILLPAQVLWRVTAAIAVLYLAPPLLARTLRALFAIPEGKIPLGSQAFFSWWALFQLQMIFSRLPQLEEMLRLVPGAYSAWLRLWGAQIGRLTFWSPGTVILDRPFLSVGDDVVFGAAIHINPHVLAKNASGRIELILGTVKIGDRVRIGGYSLLTAGSEIAPDEDPRALLVLPPFSTWKNGKRVRADKFHKSSIHARP
jgi:hypothetical protein